ncbi:MAG: GTP-binding protein YsxC [Candidatus Entotheonella gemina]|uniref:Probable GTP-binding protein EngB n=1 Tax=Candidatus Entotheonella gemina TaxID=1429439 RepID=W4ME61_9BACT|nr:MAG: GTP-binding protein YsxC [Candidatus Entotheonella gemina]
MKVLSAEFLLSAVSVEHYPRQPMPEVAFAGRSNVGKSSLINTLLLHKGLAKTSSTPGKTQAINFFVINQRCMLVDLPGYGYAKVPQHVKASWGKMIETYLQQRAWLRAVVQIVDLRHAPTPLDQQLRDWLLHYGIEIVTVATKADKLKRSQRAKQMGAVRRVLGMAPEEPLYLFSSLNREGRQQLWSRLDELLLPPVRWAQDGSGKPVESR